MEAGPMSGKRKSNLRWQSGRHIHDQVLPTLESTAQAAVLMACWFHARGADCVFDCTAGQIAREVKLSRDWVKKILQRLEQANVITTVKPGFGRGNPAVRAITGKPFTLPDKRKKGVSHNHL